FPGKNGKIAFQTPASGSGGFTHVYSINPDGTALGQLDGAEGGAAPAWSPDGTKIAFESFCPDVYTMNADGTGLTRLTFTGRCDDPSGNIYSGAPTWSPDGSEIAFVSNRDGGVRGDPELYKMNADGTNQTRLTDDDVFEQSPAWSPDGTKIAFVYAPNGQTTDSDIHV